MIQNLKPYLSILFLFIILNGIIIIAKTFFDIHGFNIGFLQSANLLLFFISLIGFLFQQKGLQSTNPNAFVRGVYASMIFKIFICMIAALVYFFIARNNINKPALFTAMGLYIVYTVVEVIMLMKLARKKRNV